MKSKIETITPAIARDYLKSNIQNRSVRELAVSQYATEMKAGRWLLTHQGIAFDDTGNLIDGQHRLLAIIEANVPVDMQVSRGLASLKSNGSIVITPQDVADGGRKRTVADQLYLCHGVENSTLVTAAAKSIFMSCCEYQNESHTLTMAAAQAVLAIYKPQIESVIAKIAKFRPIRRAAFIGAFSFAAKSEPEALRFVEDVACGEGLRKGDPALAFRNHISNVVTRLPSSHSVIPWEWALNALFNEVHAKPVTNIRRGAQGRDFFMAKQKENVRKIRAYAGL